MRSDGSFDGALYRYTRVLPTALAYRDMVTRQHSDRVCGLSVAVGKSYGLGEVELNALRLSAFLHDIGKIGIPDHVLMKPAQLDATERDLMQQHSEMGEKIVLATGLESARQCALVVRSHHEHYDGRGYPDGLAGENIPVCSRIISIADSYDAMAVARPYHRARPHRDIVEILDAEAGTKHDPELLAIFMEVIETSELRADG